MITFFLIIYFYNNTNTLKKKSYIRNIVYFQENMQQLSDVFINKRPNIKYDRDHRFFTQILITIIMVRIYFRLLKNV